MKYQKHIAILLLLLFTAASVMAGFNRGTLSVSVSASAKCGDIEVTLYTYEGTNPTKHTFTDHDYSKVTYVTPSHGCNYTVDAEYSIFYTVKAEGDTDTLAVIKITGDSAVLDSNGNGVGNTGKGFSIDRTARAWPDLFFHFQRSFTVSEKETYDWKTKKPGDYKAAVYGSGSAQSVRGGGGNINAPVPIKKGGSFTLGLGWNSPTVRTGHEYTNGIEVINGVPHARLTFIDEDDFTVGSQTWNLSKYYTSSP